LASKESDSYFYTNNNLLIAITIILHAIL